MHAEKKGKRIDINRGNILGEIIVSLKYLIKLVGDVIIIPVCKGSVISNGVISFHSM